MIGLHLLIPLSIAAQPVDLVDRVVQAWDNTRAYCASFVFALHGRENTGVNTGKSCVDRSGRILTETDGPLGPVIDIRLPGEAWYYDPGRPVVVHLLARTGALEPLEMAGQGIGEWVEVLTEGRFIRPLADRDIGGRAHWVVEVTPQEGEGTTVLFIDQEYSLPTALELRRDGVALLSSGYTGLVLNPEIPDAYFQIGPLFNVPTVEVEWDPNMPPAQAARAVR